MTEKTHLTYPPKENMILEKICKVPATVAAIEGLKIDLIEAKKGQKWGERGGEKAGAPPRGFPGVRGVRNVAHFSSARSRTQYRGRGQGDTNAAKSQ